MTEKNYTQYAVIVFPDLTQLVTETTSALTKGWVLVGGIATAVKGNDVFHYQAIAK